ncbi:MAG: isopeptide-forming domain-containing fimbrial protein, partial [Wujia sp.]
LDKKDAVYKGVDVDKTAGTYNPETRSIEYTITAQNNNSYPVSGVTVKDSMGRYLEYDSSSLVVNGGATVTPSVDDGANRVDFTVDNIPANTTVEIKYSCTVSEAALANANSRDGNFYGLDNTITAKYNDYDMYLDSTKKTYDYINDFSVKKDLVAKEGTKDEENGQITWKITINAGSDPYDIAGYVFTDTLDSNLTLVADSVTVTGGSEDIQAGLKTVIEGTADSYTFPEGTTGEITIEYKTSIPANATGINTYKNKAELVKDTYKDTAEPSVTMGSKYAVKVSTADTSVPPVIEDTTYGEDNEGELLLPWKTTITIPKGADVVTYLDSIEVGAKGKQFVDGSGSVTVSAARSDNTPVNLTGKYAISYPDDGTNWNGDIKYMQVQFTGLAASLTADKALVVTIEYKTIGSYKDRTVNDWNDEYTNYYHLTVDDKTESGSARVFYSYTEPDTGDKVKKKVGTVDEEKGLINWEVEVDATGKTEVVFSDTVSDMSYYGCDHNTSYVWDGSDTSDKLVLVQASSGDLYYAKVNVVDAVDVDNDTQKSTIKLEFKPENFRGAYWGGYGENLSGIAEDINSDGQITSDDLSDGYFTLKDKVTI